MRNTDYFRNKKITIIGLARSGLACANLLSDLGAQVSITDQSDSEQTRSFAKKLNSSAVKIELGKHTREFISGRDLIVISPGVPDLSQAVVWAKELNIPIISEVEVAWILSPAEVIAITGTNGKTTTTTLIGKILKESGKNVFVCGNIGNPFSGEVQKIKPGDFVVLEISSFQLEYIKSFKPKIALILNLSRNHLDRYNDMAEYLSAKARIFLNQDGQDTLILNNDDPAIRDLAGQARSKVVYFTRENGLNPNQSAALACASVLGIKKEVVLKVFENFKGVEHRLEEAAEIHKIKYINDSKATTVDAAIWGLKNTVSPIILIAGGREKGNDYSLILDLVREKVKFAVLIGEAKEKIKKSFSGLIPVYEAASLEEAVRIASEKASSGDSVLFSPMCKSFDMFTDYEHRGREFKRIVSGLK